MATQTLTFATTATQLTKLTIPNVSSLPRTRSVESIKLIGGNPSPSSSSSQPLQRSSSASEMLALVNLANLQRLHIRASEPSSSSVASFDDDLDDLENPASSSSSSSDSEECETPDQVSPPFTRPTSPIGFVSEDEEEEWDLRNIKYTAGADLTPCFARGSAGAELRSSFSDSEDDEDDEGMVIQKKRSWIPGTPAIEKVEYHWNNTPSTSSASTPLAASEEEDGYFDDGDDDDMVGSEVDAGEVWPDEMDSDDFPYLHSWPHSWIWTPPSATKNPTPHALPQIHFHYVESQISDQSSWTPLQDSRFGGCLTVPGHRVYNCPPAAPAARGRQLGSATTLVPVQQVCEAAKVEYDEKLGRCAVTVPSLKEQQERGLYSTLSLSVLAASSASSSSSSSSKRGRTRARSRVRGMPEDEDEDEDAEEGRGRSAARRSMGGCQFVLSAIRDADEDEDEEFVYDGASGQARAGRWD